MQKIKNVGEVISQLKPLLRTYLEEKDTRFKGPLFTCPNKDFHENEDAKPSAGFIPDKEETVWNCFTCGKSGDIFTAYHHLEGKEVQGANFYRAVKELADRYGIRYELEEMVQDEKDFDTAQQFLQKLTETAHRYLIQKKPKEALQFLKGRDWLKVVKRFQLGYLPRDKKIKNFFISAFKQHPEIKNYIGIADEQIVGRLICPIKHKYGIILGLVHRAIDKNDTRPKYQKHLLKSLKKGGTLFNLTSNYKKVYLVEGGSSVLTMYKYGIKNAVSTLGTAFTPQMYNVLVKNGVKEMVICFDGDKAGKEALDGAIKLTQNKSDIRIYVKELTLNKDPDDILREDGKEEFLKIPEVSNFKYQLNKLKELEDDKAKESLFEIITSCKDSLIKEKMIKLFVKEMDVGKSLLAEELSKFEKRKGIINDVGVGELLEEEDQFSREVEKFEEMAWRTGKLKGVSTGFPILDEKIDGLQDGLILIAGKWNTGKSAFMISLALNLIKSPDNHIIYFSIDDPIWTTTIPRFVANISLIPINTISKPVYGIEKSEILEEAEKAALRGRREEAIKLLKESYKGRLGLKDSSHGYDLQFVEKMIKIHKVLAKDKKLIIFVDFMNMIHYNKNVDTTEREAKLAGFLKHVAGLYHAPVVASVEAMKDIGNKGMRDTDVKGSSSIQHRADLMLLLFSDYESNDQSKMYFYDEDSQPQPIVEVKLGKNKMSGYKGRIYFKFYKSFSKFEEFSEEEQKDVRKKI